MKFILLCVLGFIIGTKGDQCITPDDEDGECVYIKTCKFLMDILGKPYKTYLDIYRIRAHGDACQHTKKYADVCCPISKSMPPETATTKIYVPPIQEGCAVDRCVSIYNCSVLLQIAMNPNITIEDKQYLRDRQCKNNADKFSVCCPEPELPDNTAEVQVKIQRCWTTKCKPGSCVPILECMSLRKLSVKSHRTYQETELLKQSICGTDNLTYKVCCSENEIEKNRDVLPTTEECGKYDAITNRIIGGAQTGIEEYAWTALLLYASKNASIEIFGCGGSLINKYYVITAAHCREINGAPVIKVRLGDWDITEDKDCDDRRCEPPERTMEISINNIIIHPRYNPINLDYDVALLRLENRVEYTRFIKPICLPMDVSIRGKRYDGKSTTIVGWGSTNVNTTYSPIKLKATVQIFKSGDQYIHGEFGENITVSEHKIYATGNGNDSCHGDSGGPLMIEEEVNDNKNWYLIGIISYGNLNNTCGTEESIGIYARVSSFLDWINDTIRT